MINFPALFRVLDRPEKEKAEKTKKAECGAFMRKKLAVHCTTDTLFLRQTSSTYAQRGN